MPGIELTEEQKKEYTQAFEVFDKNKDGMISRQELKTIMRSLGQNPTEDDIEEMLLNVDRDKDGQISYDEFMKIISQQIKASEDVDEMEEAFAVFDVDKDGYITKSELRQVMNRLGENLTDKQLDAMIKEADKDGDGKINAKEFKALMN
ncbi:calmodulin [Blastocystis sp. subtype 4]|uniref:calmodulin n=1 Tax=Blastocystis sp. subtype 4 TaxID=944170 RepID=UPI000711E6FA|nr:calmodulin [Blastocystis sp. subtype 4]KNB42912.1 calmodulin [Blastocystis sp. subtype 4]|eukprot:XP_014526355.1 calmodulin [Blastocystis sp. subtype 4]